MKSLKTPVVEPAPLRISKGLNQTEISEHLSRALSLSYGMPVKQINFNENGAEVEFVAPVKPSDLVTPAKKRGRPPGSFSKNKAVKVKRAVQFSKEHKRKLSEAAKQRWARERSSN